MEETNDKRECCWAVAVFQKEDCKKIHYIAREHIIHVRTVKEWIDDYIKKGIEGLKIRESYGRKPKITDEDREIILSVLFNDPYLFGYLRNRPATDNQRLECQLDAKEGPGLELLYGKDYEDKKGVEIISTWQKL